MTPVPLPDGRSEAARKIQEQAGSRATGTPEGEWNGAGPEHGYPGPDGDNPNYKLMVRLSPLCARPTEKITATISSVPGGTLAFIVSHPDGNPRGNHFVGDVPPTGELVYTWIIAPDVPPGKGRFMATGGMGNQSAAATQVFEVERLGRACA